MGSSWVVQIILNAEKLLPCLAKFWYVLFADNYALAHGWQ